jgi:hypothetical protein
MPPQFASGKVQSRSTLQSNAGTSCTGTADVDASVSISGAAVFRPSDATSTPPAWVGSQKGMPGQPEAGLSDGRSVSQSDTLKDAALPTWHSLVRVSVRGRVCQGKLGPYRAGQARERSKAEADQRGAAGALSSSSCAICQAQTSRGAVQDCATSLATSQHGQQCSLCPLVGQLGATLPSGGEPQTLKPGHWPAELQGIAESLQTGTRHPLDMLKGPRQLAGSIKVRTSSKRAKVPLSVSLRSGLRVNGAGFSARQQDTITADSMGKEMQAAPLAACKQQLGINQTNSRDRMHSAGSLSAWDTQAGDAQLWLGKGRGGLQGDHNRGLCAWAARAARHQARMGMVWERSNNA